MYNYMAIIYFLNLFKRENWQIVMIMVRYLMKKKF